MALTGPRSVAMNRLHPCSHWPLFAIAPTHLYSFINTGIFEEDLYLFKHFKKIEIFKYLGQPPHTLKSNSRVIFKLSNKTTDTPIFAFNENEILFSKGQNKSNLNWVKIYVF